MYTRDGTLERSPEGLLVQKSGYPILTEGGTVTVPPSAELAVAPDGTVLVNGTSQGKLRIVTLSDAQEVRHAGTGLLSSTGSAEPDTTSRVIQGSVEGANVDPVLTMVDMVTLLRGYEANQKAIQAQDRSLGQLIQFANG